VEDSTITEVSDNALSAKSGSNVSIDLDGVWSSNSIVFSAAVGVSPSGQVAIQWIRDYRIPIDPKHKDVHWQLETNCGESEQKVLCIAQETVLPR
jgi:hypothetical protein